MMNKLFRYITLEQALTLILIFPVAIRLGNYAGKPIDIVASDALFPFTLLLLFIFYKVKTIKRRDAFFIHLLLLACIYYVGLGAVGTLFFHHQFIAIISAIRFSKSLLLGIVGVFLLPQKSHRRFAKALLAVIAVYPVVLLLSDIVFNPKFPRTRLGGWFGSYQIYGFPNSAALMGVVLSCFLLLFILTANRKRHLFHLLSLLLYVILSVMSLSRNAVIAEVTALTSSYFLIKKRIYAMFIILFIGISLYSLWGYLLEVDYFYAMQQSLINRFLRTLEQTEDMSGRLVIWEETLELIQDKPLLGYMFEPFSYYHRGHDTPHQQYLEIFYKSGIIGFFLYMGLFVYGLRVCYQVHKIHTEVKVRWMAGGTFLAGIVIGVSNFFQPNLSYSLTANFFWFMVGLNLAIRNRHLASLTIKTQKRA